MIGAEIYGKGNEIWEVDEGLRNTATELLSKFPDILGHIELNQVIFVRANEVKLNKSGKNWYGKCWLVRPPLQIMPRFTLLMLSHAGLVDAEAAFEKIDDMLDPAYIIAINTAAIEEEGGPIDKIEEITLHHELLHISQDMDKLVQHDVQDFCSILNEYGLHWTSGIIEESDKKQEPAFLDSFIDKLNNSGAKIITSVEESD